MTMIEVGRRRVESPPGEGSDLDDFNSWVRPHLSAMSLFAGRLVPAADRDDVVQDSLERAWTKRSTFDPDKGSPRNWLLAVVKDRARRHRTRTSPATSDLADVDLVVVDTYRDHELDRAIAGLPSRQKLAINLHYFVGLDIKDCAEVMACAPGTVKATLHKARAHLNKTLSPGGLS